MLATGSWGSEHGGGGGLGFCARTLHPGMAVETVQMGWVCLERSSRAVGTESHAPICTARARPHPSMNVCQALERGCTVSVASHMRDEIGRRKRSSETWTACRKPSA